MKNHFFSLLFSKKTVWVYLAALLSFISILARDFYLINFTSHSSYIFSFFYVASLFSGFPINTIILNKKFSSSRPYLLLISLMLIIFTASYLMRVIPFNLSVITLVTVLILWISGAVLSRIIMDCNLNFLLARSRETIATLILICLLVMGVTLNFSIFLSCLISFLVLSGYLIYKDQGSLKKWNSRSENFKFVDKDFAKILLLSNLAITLMTLWALNKTTQQTIVFSGISSEVLARFSMYLFQGLSLLSLMFTFEYVPSKAMKKSFLWLAIFFSFAYFLYSGLTEFFSVPLALAFLHFYLILSLK